MAVALVLLLAAPPLEPLPVPVPVDAIDYRLPLDENPRIVEDCRRGGGDEIVVCGRREDPNRLRELTPPPGTAPRTGVIGHDLSFGRVEPLMETIVRSDGWVDKRVMVTLKIPF